jgi:hypothetical protein
MKNKIIYNCHCEERSDVAISDRGVIHNSEIASLRSQ